MADGIISEFQGEFRFLSNFWPCIIEYEGILYPSVEHAFQAQKTLDNAQKLAISQLATPGEAKRAGSHVLLRSDWEQVKNLVMFDLLKKKFQDPLLKSKLLSTDYNYLVEGNRWHDIYWGVDLNTGIGQNHLGILLMEIRKLYRGY